MAHVPTRIEKRILRAIETLDHIGQLALQRCPSMKAVQRGREPMTLETVAEFLDALHPLVVQQQKDEQALERQVGEYRSAFVGARKILKWIEEARP